MLLCNVVTASTGSAAAIPLGGWPAQGGRMPSFGKRAATWTSIAHNVSRQVIKTGTLFPENEGVAEFFPCREISARLDSPSVFGARF